MSFNLNNVSLDSLIPDQQQFEKGVSDPLEMTLKEAMKENPDQRARVSQLSRETSIPEEAVIGDIDEVERKFNLSNIDTSSMAESSPKTARFLSDFSNAAVTHDDTSTLERMERWVNDVKTYGSDIVKSFERGSAMRESSDIGVERIYGALGLSEGATVEQLLRLEDIDRQIFDDEQYSFIQGIPLAAAEQLPILGGMALEAIKYGAIGAATGALVGRGAGASVGFRIGSRVGVASDAFRLEGGLAFNEFASMKDEFNNTIDPKIAAYGAIGVGLINAGLETVSFTSLGKTVTPAMKTVIKKKIKNLLQSDSGRESLKHFASNYLKYLGTESITEGVQEFSNIVAGEFVKMADDNSFTETVLSDVIDNIFTVETVERVTQAATKGLQASILLGSPGTIASAVMHKKERDIVYQDEQAKIDELNDITADPNAKRDPEKFRQFAQSLSQDDNVFIDGPEAVAYLQQFSQDEIKSDPALTTLNDQVTEIRNTGGDAVVQISDFVTDFTGSLHYDQLRQHMTLSAESLSPFRQEQAQQETQRFHEMLMDQAQENVSQYVEAQEIYMTIRDQLVDTGRMSQREASITAEIVPAYFTAKSVSTGIPVAELFKQYGFTVEGPQTGRAAELSERALRQTVFHGTPHLFDKFSIEFMSTGEGAQAFGFGVYLAEDPKIAGSYRDILSKNRLPVAYDNVPLDEEASRAINRMSRVGYEQTIKTLENSIKAAEEGQPFTTESVEELKKSLSFAKSLGSYDESKLSKGFLYKVDVPDNVVEKMLDWDKPLSEQPYIMSRLDVDDKSMLPNRLKSTMTGQELHDAMVRGETNLGIRPGKKNTADFLKSKGIEGIKYFDASSRSDKTGTRNLVIFDTDNIKIQSINDLPPDSFKQEGDRGYYDPVNSMIRLTESSDLSTFLHEFAHFVYDTEIRSSGELLLAINEWFLRNSVDVAKEASKYAKSDITVESVEAYINEGTSGDNKADPAIERAMHEQFARGFETYLMEGKAPSAQLRNVFRVMARWLTQVYRAVRGKLNVKVDSEMRQVFDRLLATEEQIEAAAARARFEPLFENQEQAGMTEKEFQAYKKKQDAPKDKAKETLRDKIIKQLERQTKSWWNEEKQVIVEQEKVRLEGERVYSTMNEMKTGEFKLDRFALKQMVGEKKVNKKGKESFRAPAVFNGMHVTGGNGFHPDVLAPMFGYGSGMEMLHDIMNAPKIQEVAEANAERIMVERHGDIMNDGSIQREADQAVQNEERGDLLLQELKTLNRRTGRAQADRMAIKSLAEDAIGKLSFRQIHPGKYHKAEVQAAQEAAVALAAGDLTTAANAKSRQVMNFYLNKAAQEARQDILAVQEFMFRYRKKSVREAIQKAGKGYWEQLNKILSRFEFRRSASLKAVDEINEALATWVKERTEVDGDRVVLTSAVMDETYQTHWKNVPYADLLGVRDSVKNLEHVARYSNKLDVLEEKMDFQDFVNQWVNHMNEASKDRYQETASRADKPNKAIQLVRGWMAETTKIPFLASWLDGNERAGMSHDVLIHNVDKAYNEKMRMMREVALPVAQMLQAHMSKHGKRFATKVFIPEIKGTAGHTGNLMMDEVLAIAMNTGNQGNLRKMILGEGWATPEQQDFQTIDNPKLQAVLKHLHEEDWQLVQNIWNKIDQLYQPLADTYAEATGLTMPKVEPVAFSVGQMEIQGGYYPIKYDRNRSQRAEENAKKAEAETDSMFSLTSGINASVAAGAVNSRTEFYDPISLSLDVIPNHIHETVHYIAFHDTVRQLNKLIKNPAVAKTIKAKVGQAEYDELHPWLNDIAKDGREQSSKLFWDKAFHRLRFGVTLGTLGFSASTNIVQLLGLSTTMAEVGPSNFFRGLRNIVGSKTRMAAAWEFAVEHSNIMQHRMESMDREIRHATAKIQNRDSKLAALQEASMKSIAMIQTYIVDLPTWHAAYMKGLKDWGDEKRAARYADWTVKNVQGSGLMGDSARIMRNQSGFWAMFTQFMTFFSAQWNLQRDLIRGMRNKQYSITSIAAKLTFIYLIPVFAEILMRGEFGGDSEENTEKYLTSLALYPVTGLPVVRDIAGGLLTDYGYNMSPIGKMIESAVDSAEGMMSDEELSAYKAKSISKLAGALFAIPGVNQMWRTGEHLYDVIEEGEDFSVHQAMFGPKRD